MSRIAIITKPILFASALATAFAIAAPVGFDSHGALVVKQAVAKNGADDPKGHDKNDDKGGATKGGKGGKGRGGHDDGPNHR